MSDDVFTADDVANAEDRMRQVAAARAASPEPTPGLREAAENVSDRRTLLDDGFWVSRKEMRALDLALGREDIDRLPAPDNGDGIVSGPRESLFPPFEPFEGDDAEPIHPNRNYVTASPEPTPGLRAMDATVLLDMARRHSVNDPEDGNVRVESGTWGEMLVFIDWYGRAALASPAPEPTPGLREALSDAVKRAGVDEIADALVFAFLDGTFADATEEQVRHAVYEAVGRAAAPEPTGLDAAVLAKVLEYTGDGEGEGYHGARYRQYAENIIAAYESSARLNGVK